MRRVRWTVVLVATALLLAACGLLTPAAPDGPDGPVGPGEPPAPAPLPDGPGVWTELTSPTSERQEVSFAFAAGRFYLGGGSNAGSFLDGHEAFDAESGAWTDVRSLPQALDHIQSVALFDRVFYVGGLQQWPGPNVSTVYVYDPATDTFATGGDMGERGRGAGGVAAYEGRIYYAGGLNGEGSGSSVAVPWFDVYDPATETWRALPDMPHARDHFQAVVVDGRFYAIGGRDLAVDATIDAVDVYDFATGAWETLDTALPTERGGFAAAVLGREILIIGGESAEGVHDEVEAYDTLLGTWRTLAPLPVARHGIQAAVCGDAVYLAGGGGVVGDQDPRSEAHVFAFDGAPEACGGLPAAPSGLVWLAEGRPDPVARAETNGVVVGGRLIVPGGFFGRFEEYCATRSTVAYDPAADQWTALADLPADWTHAGIAYDGRWVHLAGGRRIGSDCATVPAPEDRIEESESVIWSYDVESDAWRNDVLPPLPGPRSAGGLVRIGRDLHFFGGTSTMASDEGDHWALDLDAATPTWEPRAPMVTPRNHFGVALVAGRVYVVGGQFGTGYAADLVTAVDRYDPLTDTWEAVADLPGPTSHVMGGTVPYGNGMLVLGGDQAIATFRDEVRWYDAAADAWTTIGALPDAHQAPVAAVIDGRLVVSHGNFEQTTFRADVVSE